MQGPAKRNNVTATIAVNHVGQRRFLPGKTSPALSVGKRFTERNGKLVKDVSDFAQFNAKPTQHEGCMLPTGGTYLLRGCVSNGLERNAKSVAHPKNWNSTTLSQGSLAGKPSAAMRRRYAGHAIDGNIGTRICRITPFCDTATQDVFKPSLIDLEARQRATRHKQAQAVQCKRLSERARYPYSVMRQSEPPHNFRRIGGGRSEAIAPPIELLVSRREPKATDCMYYSGGEVLNIGSSDVLTSAEFDWKQAACAVTATGLETEIQNTGKEQIIDLMAARIKNAQRTMRNNICSGIYSDGTGTGGKQIGGLQLLVADAPTTGTVGGINRASFSFWQSQVYDATTDGGAATSATNIQAYMNSLWLECSRGPDQTDLIMADSVYYGFFLGSLQAIQRISDSKMANAGFQSIAYKGADVVYEDSTGMPASHMYFINSDYLFFRYAPKRLFKPLEKMQSIHQDATVQLITFAGNLTASNCARQGVLKE